MARPAPPDLAAREIGRAARLLWVRSRRETTEPLTGEYASAFRGGGIEFEESRPYAPGDDVRALDWNALARTGEPWVKRFAEERSRTVLIALDVSASMAFGSGARSKAWLGAHAAALLAAAAGRMGDRVGFVAFADGVRESLPPRRGEGHGWRVIRAAVRAAARPAGHTRLTAAVEWIRDHARGRAVIACVSDFRDARAFGREAGGTAYRDLAVLARRHDAVAVICEDPRERAVPAVGPVRLEDPERPGAVVTVRTGDPRARERYARAAAARGALLERQLRRARFDPVWLSTAADPLVPLARFFRQRAAHIQTAP